MGKRELYDFKESRYTGKKAGPWIPDLPEIHGWLKHCVDLGQFEPASLTVMVIYIKRLEYAALTPETWKSTCLIALMLAQKMYDDQPLINSDFPILYPVLTAKEYNYLERQFLSFLDFKVSFFCATVVYFSPWL